MPGEDNSYTCSRCRHKFVFTPEPTEGDNLVEVQVKCPNCGSGYVRKIFTFPKGYASKPHS